METRHEVIDRIRAFNRFYTSLLGLLDRHYLDSPFSLTEVRVLYEIRHTPACTAKAIRANMVIDEGYLSRIIDTFIRKGLVKRRPSPHDGRVNLITLTGRGRRAFSNLNDRSNRALAAMIADLSDDQCADLARMMERLRGLLIGHRTHEVHSR